MDDTTKALPTTADRLKASLIFGAVGGCTAFGLNIGAQSYLNNEAHFAIGFACGVTVMGSIAVYLKYKLIRINGGK